MPKILFPLFAALCVNFLHANNAFVEAGKAFGVDSRILWAIAYKESRHTPHIVSKANKNGTYDIGIMQINSSHLAWLKNYGINQKTLLENPRINIFTGAMILRRCFDTHGANQNGITCYNGRISGNPYGKEVLQILASAEKQHKQKTAKQRVRNYFIKEKQMPFIRVIND